MLPGAKKAAFAACCLHLHDDCQKKTDTANNSISSPFLPVCCLCIRGVFIEVFIQPAFSSSKALRSKTFCFCIIFSIARAAQGCDLSGAMPG